MPSSLCLLSLQRSTKPNRQSEWFLLLAGRTDAGLLQTWRSPLPQIYTQTAQCRLTIRLHQRCTECRCRCRCRPVWAFMRFPSDLRKQDWPGIRICQQTGEVFRFSSVCTEAGCTSYHGSRGYYWFVGGERFRSYCNYELNNNGLILVI